eukprot:9807134-Alexandrium_andersonii.AAC.1
MALRVGAGCARDCMLVASVQRQANVGDAPSARCVGKPGHVLDWSLAFIFAAVARTIDNSACSVVVISCARGCW